MIKPYLMNSDSTIQRKRYVAPAVLVETFVEEGEMLAATPVTGTTGDTGGNSGGGDEDPIPGGAKNTDLFFDDKGIDW